MAVGALKAIKKARETRQRAVRQQLQQFLVDGQQQALAAVVMAAQATEEEAGRRTVERAAGKWRGSTIGGYLRGDNRTYLENFRCSRHHFKDLSSRSCATVAWTNHVLRVGAARFQQAHEMRDAPVQSCSMHVCSRACGPLKVLANVASIFGERMERVPCASIPCTCSQRQSYHRSSPFSAEELAAVEGLSAVGCRMVFTPCSSTDVQRLCTHRLGLYAYITPTLTPTPTLTLTPTLNRFACISVKVPCKVATFLTTEFQYARLINFTVNATFQHSKESKRKQTSSSSQYAPQLTAA